MKEKKVLEKEQQRVAIHIITEPQAIFLLRFLQDLDIPSKTLKQCMQILQTLPAVPDEAKKPEEVN